MGEGGITEDDVRGKKLQRQTLTTWLGRPVSWHSQTGSVGRDGGQRSACRDAPYLGQAFFIRRAAIRGQSQANLLFCDLQYIVEPRTSS
jgi:hypothetical protein